MPPRQPTSPAESSRGMIMTRARTAAVAAIQKRAVHVSQSRQRVMTRAYVKSLSKETASAAGAVEDTDVTVERRENWLDDLPLEICVKIACKLTTDVSQEDYLNRWRQSRNMLNLAETSMKQRDAVLEALAFTLYFPTEFPERWASFFRGSVKIAIMRWRRVREALPLLRSSTLRIVEIPNRASYLKAVVRATALVDLTLRLSDVAPAELLLQVLKKLDLEALSLKCSLRYPWRTDQCLFRGLFTEDREYEELGKYCQNVTKLSISCNCYYRAKESDLAPFMRLLPKLKQLTIDRAVPDDAIPYVQGLEEVVLLDFREGSKAACRVAARIGKPVTAIIQSNLEAEPRDSSVGTEEAEQLSRCPNLKRLEIYLEAGAEEHLPFDCALTSLQLHWDGQHLRGAFAREYNHLPSTRFFANVASLAKGLNMLCLYDIRMPMEYLEGMLNAAGDKLQLFGASTDCDDEGVHCRTLGILAAVANSNPGLKKLTLISASIPVYRDPYSWRSSLVALRKSFILLRRRNPLLDFGGLRSCLYHTLCHSEVYEW